VKYVMMATRWKSPAGPPCIALTLLVMKAAKPISSLAVQYTSQRRSRWRANLCGWPCQVPVPTGSMSGAPAGYARPGSVTNTPAVGKRQALDELGAVQALDGSRALLSPPFGVVINDDVEALGNLERGRMFA